MDMGLNQQNYNAFMPVSKLKYIFIQESNYSLEKTGVSHTANLLSNATIESANVFHAFSPNKQVSMGISHNINNIFCCNDPHNQEFNLLGSTATIQEMSICLAST